MYYQSSSAYYGKAEDWFCSHSGGAEGCSKHTTWLPILLIEGNYRMNYTYDIGGDEFYDTRDCKANVRAIRSF